jgi:signal transduction histidine kinase
MKRTRTHLSAGETGLVLVYRPIVRVYLLVMTVYYAGLAFAHQVFLSGWPAWLMSGVATAASVMAFCLYRYVKSAKQRRITELSAAALAMHGAVLANVSTHTVALNAPDQLGYLPIFAFAVAMIGPTRRAVLVGLGAVLAALFALSIIIKPLDHVHLVFMAAIVTVGACVAAHWVHGRVKQELIQRMRAQSLLSRVVAERERNRDLLAQKAAADAANAARAQFTANMSHELRTPLNAIKGYGELLLETEDFSENAAARGDIARILLAADCLLHLVNDVLDLSKMEAGEFKVQCAAIDVRAECEKALDILRPSAQAKGLHLILDAENAPSWAFADVRRLQQCVINLLSNAIKFTERGGVTMRLRTVGSMTEIEVEDTGIGIPQAHLQKIFLPFEQVDSSLTRRHVGTGLGLAITSRLVNLMGGDVRVQSTPGAGSRFTLRVPVKAAHTAPRLVSAAA